ncbi:MAG: hypothetical protein A2V46_15680 [Bacteroidetes bacterium RBG_19FT_COMBO_42_7]|nr:MAG: hypothetical protein A2V46_15680 [Bacteroidetes bacterium RBG_19FT_COMBO_42_7]
MPFPSVYYCYIFDKIAIIFDKTSKSFDKTLRNFDKFIMFVNEMLHYFMGNNLFNQRSFRWSCFPHLSYQIMQKYFNLLKINVISR